MEELRNNSTLQLLKRIGRYKHCVYRELIPLVGEVARNQGLYSNCISPALLSARQTEHVVVRTRTAANGYTINERLPNR